MITDKQREQRLKHLGSSDMASILGLNPFKSAYDIWLEKTGKVGDTPINEDMKLGLELEQAILNIAEPELGTLIRNQYRSAKKEGLPVGSNCDALVVATGEPVEAKTTGIRRGRTLEHWGDAGTDDIPHRVIVQCATQLICTDKDLCYIPALIGGRGYCMFAVYRDKQLVDIICEKAVLFWQNNVLKDMPPSDSLPSLEFLKKIKREPKLTVDLSPHKQIVEDYIFSKEFLSKAEGDKKIAEICLLEKLGQAEAGTYDGGIITYYSQTRKPKLCMSCGAVVSEGCAFPVLRIKQNNKELNYGTERKQIE